MQPTRSRRLDSLPPWRRAFRALPFLLLFILPILQLQRHFQDLQVYPFADEWLYVAVSADGADFPWTWLWEQHGDHRIPLQKAVQWLILDASQLDFRALVLFNLCVAASTCMLLLLTIRNLRGNSSPWDMMVPLLVFNPMAGYALWGFHLQFLSSAFFTSLFAWAIVRPAPRRGHLLAGLFAILLCSLCGLNGLLQAGFMLPLLWLAAPAKQRSISLCASLLAAAFLLAWFWTSWSRTGEVAAAPSVAEQLQFFNGLLGASFLPPRDGPMATLIIGALTMGSMAAASATSARTAELQRSARIALLLGVVVLAQLAAVAWGRARYQGGWQPTLAMHYGALSMLLPLLAWLALAAKSRGRSTQVLGLVFTAIFATGWLQAEQWRTRYTSEMSSKKAEAYRDIKNDHLTDEALIDRNGPLYWGSDPSARKIMLDALPILRRAYQLKWPVTGPEDSGDQRGQRGQRPAASPLRR